MNKVLDFFNKIMGLIVFLIFLIVLMEHLHHAHHHGMRHLAGGRVSGDTAKVYSDSSGKK